MTIVFQENHVPTDLNKKIFMPRHIVVKVQNAKAKKF